MQNPDFNVVVTTVYHPGYFWTAVILLVIAAVIFYLFVFRQYVWGKSREEVQKTRQKFQQMLTSNLEQALRLEGDRQITALRSLYTLSRSDPNVSNAVLDLFTHVSEKSANGNYQQLVSRVKDAIARITS